MAAPTVDYRRFLSALFDDGRVRVPAVEPLSAGEVAAGDAVLLEFERQYRLDLPAGMPVFDIPAARWAATRFYRACQFSVYRDMSEKTLARELDDLSGQSRSAAVHYSVDVVFRYLPDLANFAAAASEGDPLVGHLRRWARQWPLSSVGMRGVEAAPIDGFAGCPGLMRLYTDRILARQDRARLDDPRAREAVEGALGMHLELAGAIGRALESRPPEEENA